MLTPAKSHSQDISPKPLWGCIDFVSASVPYNATVRALSEAGCCDSYGASGSVSDFVDSVQGTLNRTKFLTALQGAIKNLLGVHEMVPLTTSYCQSARAIALYAGDGVVVKLTETRALNGMRGDDGSYQTLPYVMPPVYFEKLFDKVYLEVFPWISTYDVDHEDLSFIEVKLDDAGFRFKTGDRKVENIGRLPNRDLAVLDGDAIEPYSPDPEALQYATTTWEWSLKQSFAKLYPQAIGKTTNDKELLSTLVSDKPSYIQKFTRFAMS